MVDIKSKYLINYVLFVVSILISTIPIVNAENQGIFALTFDEPSNSEIVSESKISALSLESKSNAKPQLNVKITQVNDTDESVYWESDITSLKNISVGIPSGTYKIYVKNMTDNSVLEYNNGSNGYQIKSGQIVPLVYHQAEGYILDAPWRIEKSITLIPILAVAYDLTAPSIHNISIYDANNNDALIQSTNWNTTQNIIVGNMPYFFSIEVNKSKFVVDTQNRIAIKIKFDLNLAFDNWEGPIYIYKTSENLPKFNN